MTEALSRKLFAVKNYENSEGVIVTKCKFPSYFRYLGIKNGDLLVSGDNKAINTDNFIDVIKKSNKLTFIRNGKSYTVNINYRFEIV